MGTVPISRERRGLPVGADQPRRTNVPIITEFRNVPIFQYANVRVTGVGGRLDVSTKSGGIVAREIGQEAELASSYGSVETRQIGGNLKVVASSGPSRISDVEGSLELKGSYADAVVERIAGAVDVETTYAGVTVVGAGGAVTVRNESGPINVKGLSGEALTARHDAETTYADIDFRWPEGRGLAYRLESSYGHLDCDFPGTLKERGSRYTLEGSTGEGGASVSLISKSGSVRLRGE